MDRLNVRAQVSSSGGYGGTSSNDNLNKSHLNGGGSSSQVTSPYISYREGAHQIKNHGAAMLKNHIGVSSNLILLNQGAAKASLTGGIAIPSSINNVQAKKIFQENNLISSPLQGGGIGGA